MTPAAETVHACPRCYQTLRPAHGRPEEGAAALLLACPESYCDYVLVLTHENGAITTIDNSRKAAYGYDQRVEAFGSLGMAQSDNHHRFQSVLATDHGYLRPPLEDFFLERYARSYLDQWAAFVDMVEHDGPSPASGADGRAPLLIGMAAVRSMQQNVPVRIADMEA